MKKIPLLLLLLHVSLFWENVSAEKQGRAFIDSLQTVLKRTKDDTNKVNILKVIAWELANTNLDSAILQSTQALQLSEKIKWQMGIEILDNELGWFNYLKGNYLIALDYYNKALAECDNIEKSGLYSNLQVLHRRSNTIGNLALLYTKQGDFAKALDYNFKSLEIDQELRDTSNYATDFTNISIVYRNLGDYSKTLEYDFKALKTDEELVNKSGMATDLGNLGMVYCTQGDYTKALNYYFKALKLAEELDDKNESARHLANIGDAYWQQGDYVKALEYDLKALKMAEEVGNKELRANILEGIGAVYQKQGNYQQALEYYNKILKMFEELEDKTAIALTLGDIGSIYIKQNKLKEADKFLDKELNLATEIKAMEIIKNANENLSELYIKKGDWKKAHEYYKQAILISDSINNEEKAKKQTRIEMNYEFDKKQAVEKAEHEKEMTVAELESKRQKLFKNVSLSGFTIMLLFAGVFFTQRNRISAGKKRSDELLLNILPSETAEELKLTGEAKAKNYDMVTVMFTDFKNFTLASERMSASELVKDVHHYYSQFDKIIAGHNIEKIKTIGDSYMCAGGLPMENKTNPVEVVQAALEIKQFVEKEKEERQKSNKPYFDLRIGIHTGPVVAGIVGIKKFAYDIWGDTVNIANRMESSSEEGKVNISGSTYEFVKEKFVCTQRGRIEAKNKGMIDMYFVEGEKS